MVLNDLQVIGTPSCSINVFENRKRERGSSGGEPSTPNDKIQPNKTTRKIIGLTVDKSYTSSK